MLVFGVRMYFRDKTRISYGDCPSCRAYASMKSYQAYQFVHVYFIPLIPTGGKKQILRECSKCTTGVQMSAADANAAADGLEESFKSWVHMLAEGESEIVVEEGAPPVKIGIMIAEHLEDLLCLDKLTEIDSLCELVSEAEMPLEHWIIRAKWASLFGDLSSSLRFCQEAVKANPKDSYAAALLGNTAIVADEPEIAQQAFDAYSAIEPTDPMPFLVLSDFYEKRKEFAGIVANLDKLFDIHPDLLSNKTLAKQYKRACKKSGLGGKYLSRV